LPGFEERALTKPVGELLREYGYKFVVSSEPPLRIDGRDEFGVPTPEGGQWRLVDVVAARWGQQSLVDAVAVECKRAGSLRDSVNAALGQATDYQTCFRQVFVATEPGELHDKRLVLESLGLGHIVVDQVRGQAEFSSWPPTAENARFSSSAHDQFVAPRLALALAFQEAFEDIVSVLRYGETRRGHIYLAKAVVGNLQWNCWWDEIDRTVSCGINVEHKADTRRITERLEPTLLANALRELLPHYRLMATKAAVPGRANAPEPFIYPRSQARQVDTLRLLAGVKEVLPDKAWRPQINVYTHVWSSSERLESWDYVSRLRTVRQELSGVMNAFASCYEEG
jgi:hypothetical protein